MVSITVSGRAGPYIDPATVGAEVGVMRLPDEAPSGSTAPWQAEKAGYTADNAQDSARFRLPFEWPDAVSGVVLIAEQDGTIYGKKGLSAGEYVIDDKLQLQRAGEYLLVSYRRNESGVDGRGDWLEARVGPDNALTAAVTLRVKEAVANPGIGLTNDEFDTFKAAQAAKDAAQDASISALERQEGQVTGDGLSAVASDGTLSGTGKASDPLKVANPFEAADEAKLDAIPDQGAGNADKFFGFDSSGDYVAKDVPSNTGEANPPAASQAEAEAGTASGLRSWSPLRIAQAIAALAQSAANIAWTAITGIPDFAKRWPAYDEVTGTKPPVDAEANVDYAEAGVDDLLAYTGSGSFALASGHVASLTHDTGYAIEDGDVVIEVSAASLAGSHELDVADLLGLPAVEAGVNLLVAGRTGDTIPFQLAGRQFYAARNAAGHLVLADGQVADQQTFSFETSGARARKFVDVRGDGIQVDDLPDIPATKVTDLPSGDGLTQAEVDARIGAAFRAGVLTGADPHKMQQIVNAFLSGGWADSTLAADAGPAISTTTLAQAFTLAQAQAATYSADFQHGARQENIHRVWRVPLAYAVPLARQRARIGGDGYDPESDSDFFHAVGGEIGEDASYRYYDLPIDNQPAADYTQAQVLTPAGIDPNWIDVGIDTLFPPPESAADDDKVYYAQWDAATGRRLPNRLADLPAVPRQGLVTIVDGGLTGVSIPSSGSDVTSALHGFAPTFDLGAADNQAGLLEAEIVLTIASRTDQTVSFTDISPYDELTSRVSDFTFVSNVRETADWSNTALNGILMAEVPIYRGANKIGDLRLYLAHDADDHMGYYWHWEASAGSYDFTISATLELAYFHNDSGGSSPRSFLESAVPAAAVDVTTRALNSTSTPTAQEGEWSPWATIMELPAVTAAQAGNVGLKAEVHGEAQETPSGGGDRLIMECKLERTRGAATATLVDHLEYTRNINSSGLTNDLYAATTRIATNTLADYDAAQAGDVYRVQGRILHQLTSDDADPTPTRSMRFSVDGNMMHMVPV